MAALRDPPLIHDEKKALERSPPDDSFFGGGERKNNGSETSSDPSTVTPSPSSSGFDDCDDGPGPMPKRAKLHHSPSGAPHRAAEEGLGLVFPAIRPHQPSSRRPTTDVHSRGRIETLPPTLRGIIDAAAILRASRSSSSSTGDASSDVAPSPSLLSFPTESVYMLACCVRTVSSRSVRGLPLRADSQASLSSSCSSKGEAAGSDYHAQEDSTAHRGGGRHRPPPREFVHPPNASLDWMMKCCVRPPPPADDQSIVGAAAPLLFVLDGQHALNFCHFTKPKTFAIRPPAISPNVPNVVDLAVPTADAPSTPVALSRATNDAREDEDSSSSFAASTTPLRAFQEPLTPSGGPASSLPAASGDGATPATPTNNRRLRAANFSESREAFLRLASKFWPGPVVIHVRVRTLGGGEEDAVVPIVRRETSGGGSSSSASSSSWSSSYPSIASFFPNVPGVGDHAAGAGSAANPPPPRAGVSVLPESVLLPASRLLTSRRDDHDHDEEEEGGENRERYFVGMQCPSHPLSRKILNEAYRGPRPKAAHSESSESLASSSSTDENGCAQRGGTTSSSRGNVRARSSGVAVVGRAAPAPPAADVEDTAAAGATTAADVCRAMASAAGQGSGGQIFVVDGEENRESFSVPTCQYGELHPVSLVVDGDSRTVHLIRSGDKPIARKDAADSPNEGTILSEASVRRALLQPAAFHSLDAIPDKKGDGTGTIDRVITAVLSRWKIQESTICF
ncbi:hypothetical protein ACHAW5_010327 [Stephanodiscus triporus]|uniref:Uncharacterized protein n=1 Tax=Stephanodiscus triporus TaxID=2934178 RepID=A0ABD3NHY5_9STRA